MATTLENAIKAVQESQVAFSKFITANDTGATGAHQYGYHIHKTAWKLCFNSEGIKGTNHENHITIKWQDDFETNSRFIYYGKKTRNEYRLTRFGKGFPFLQDENIGDLLILCKVSDDYYKAYVFQNDEDIEDFFAAMNMSTTDTNAIILKQFETNPEIKLSSCFQSFINSLNADFPSTFELSKAARNCYNSSFGINLNKIKSEPDQHLIKWLEAEFNLFKSIENSRYSERILKLFSSVEELIIFANTILNRRKSRAGKSLEHHLAEVFKSFELLHTTQSTSEEKKKPDFIFPSEEAYKDSKFDSNKLTFLASKTTCKDRWRQILNEADRIKTKHLFTLQQGISPNQLSEMYKYDVRLVVPKPYIKSFPTQFHEKILSLEGFIRNVQKNQV